MPPPMVDPLVWLRRATFVEAVSFVLLLAAMGVKYGMGHPAGAMLVRVSGSVHGGLFVWLCWCLLRAFTERQWSIARLALVFAASLLPIAPFFLDRRFPRWIADSTPWPARGDGRGGPTN